MSNRADFLQTRASLEASFRDRSARSAKHYIIAEVVAPKESEDSTPLERTLTDIRSKVLADLERALTAKLKIESPDALAGFEAIEPLVKASLEPWAYRSQSFTSEAAARIRFDTLIDLEAIAPEYLRADTPRARYEDYRENAHR